MLQGLFLLTILTCLCQAVVGQQLLASRYEVSTGCYGITHLDFILPTCAGQTIIAVEGVYLGVKQVSTGCPQIAEDGTRDEAKCCTFANGDCKIPLPVNGAGMPFYSNCTGVFQCNMRTTWDHSNACNDVGFLTSSNYMIMEYYCVKRSETLDSVASGPISAPAVYLKSNAYPTAIPAGTGATCSVSTSCATTLVVTAIHVDLEDSPGICGQTLNLTDGSSFHTLSCSHNNDFVIRTVYTSQTHFLKIDFVNTKSENGGKYWFEFKAINQAATVEIRCGTSTRTTAPTVIQCPQDSTAATTELSPASSTNNQPDGKGGGGGNGSTGTVTEIDGWMVATILLIAVTFGTGLTIFLLVKKLYGQNCCRSGRVANQQEENPIQQETNVQQDGNGLLPQLPGQRNGQLPNIPDGLFGE